MDHLNAAVHHHQRQGLTVLLDICTMPLDGPPFQCEDAVGRAGKILGYLTRENNAIQRYLERLFGMLGFMGSVAMGPSGPHAHFMRHSIDALTIRGIGTAEQGTKRTTESMTKSTSAVLNMVRSISNLEEELHHSVFSYMMLSTKAFVSIGELICATLRLFRMENIFHVMYSVSMRCLLYNRDTRCPFPQVSTRTR